MSVQTQFAESSLLNIPTQRPAPESRDTKSGAVGAWFAERTNKFLVEDGESTDNEVADHVGTRISVIRADSDLITVVDFGRFQLEGVTPETLTSEQVDLVGFSVPVALVLQELTYLANEDSAPTQDDRDLILSATWDGKLPADNLLVRALVRVAFDTNLISYDYLDQAGTLNDIWEADAENVSGGDVRGLTCPKCFTVLSKSGACACD